MSFLVSNFVIFHTSELHTGQGTPNTRFLPCSCSVVAAVCVAMHRRLKNPCNVQKFAVLLQC